MPAYSQEGLGHYKLAGDTSSVAPKQAVCNKSPYPLVELTMLIEEL
jgi:hypothetical protein